MLGGKTAQGILSNSKQSSLTKQLSLFSKQSNYIVKSMTCIIMCDKGIKWQSKLSSSSQKIKATI
jgi:hypothetical protein